MVKGTTHEERELEGSLLISAGEREAKTHGPPPGKEAPGRFNKRKGVCKVTQEKLRRRAATLVAIRGEEQPTRSLDKKRKEHASKSC